MLLQGRGLCITNADATSVSLDEEPRLTDVFVVTVVFQLTREEHFAPVPNDVQRTLSKLHNLGYT